MALTRSLTQVTDINRTQNAVTINAQQSSDTYIHPHPHSQ